MVKPSKQILGMSRSKLMRLVASLQAASFAASCIVPPMETPTYLGDRAYTYITPAGDHYAEKTLAEARTLLRNDGEAGFTGGRILRGARAVADWDDESQKIVAVVGSTADEAHYLRWA